MAIIQQKSGGILYVVGTPIGNMADISPRAIEVLSQVDVIAAEDTRHTRGLLMRIGVKTPLLACHDHNEREVAPRLIERLVSGESVALVSDAGMPLISDPGWTLVSLAIDADIEVVSIPGPCAVTAALSIAGLAADRFVFEGFLPRRSSARRSRLQALKMESRTLIFYESVHRVKTTWVDMTEIFAGDRKAVIAREITKLHESCYRGTLNQLAQRLDTEIPLAGEFVILIAGAPIEPETTDVSIVRTFEIANKHLPAKAAVALTAELCSAARNKVYRLTRLGSPENNDES